MKVNEFLLRLKLVRGIGYISLLRVASRLSSARPVDRRFLLDLGLKQPLLRASLRALEDEALAKAARTISQECRVLTFFDDLYPGQLREIYKPPLILFARGNLALLRAKIAVVVGSRTPTEYSSRIIKGIMPDLLQQKYVIASGLARGVDGLAHRSCLRGGGQTIAVIGNGLNYFYPWENHKLQKLIEKRGLVISEYLPDTQPRPYRFPQRNRILAGLAEKVIVTEAKARSGSLITANLALQENRDIYAVPGPVDSELSAGPHELIAAGATPITSLG